MMTFSNLSVLYPISSVPDIVLTQKIRSIYGAKMGAFNFISKSDRDLNFEILIAVISLHDRKFVDLQLTV